MSYTPYFNPGHLPPAELIPEPLRPFFDQFVDETEAWGKAKERLSALATADALAEAEREDERAAVAAVRANKPVPKGTPRQERHAKAIAAAEREVEIRCEVVQEVEREIFQEIERLRSDSDRADLRRLRAAEAAFADGLDALAEYHRELESALLAPLYIVELPDVRPGGWFDPSKHEGDTIPFVQLTADLRAAVGAVLARVSPDTEPASPTEVAA